MAGAQALPRTSACSAALGGGVAHFVETGRSRSKPKDFFHWMSNLPRRAPRVNLCAAPAVRGLEAAAQGAFGHGHVVNRNRGRRIGGGDGASDLGGATRRGWVRLAMPSTIVSSNSSKACFRSAWPTVRPRRGATAGL